MINGIEHLAICAEDTAKIKDWYVSTFDFKVVYDNGKGTYFVAAPDGSMIEFIQAASANGSTDEKAKGLRHIALAVEQFDEMVEKLKALAVEVVTDVVVSPNGIKTFFFKDIEGNILHLIYRPQPLI